MNIIITARGCALGLLPSHNFVIVAHNPIFYILFALFIAKLV